MKKILVVCHDAGASELLSSMISAEQDCHEWAIWVREGAPAYSIFVRKGLSGYFLAPRKKVTDVSVLASVRPDILFCGTGWGNKRLERGFIKEARRLGIPSISFLDHWVNYRERFGYPDKSWKKNLPDHIAVSDREAYRIASDLKLPNLIKIKNYYLEELIRKHKAPNAKTIKNKGVALIFSQPIAGLASSFFKDPLYYGFTETILMRDILRNFGPLAARLGLKKVVIRLHPSEEADKYDGLLKDFPGLDISVEDPAGVDLVDSINRSALTIGFDSMPLFISNLFKKPFISYMPSSADRKVPLPKKNCMNDASKFSKVNFKQGGRSKQDVLFGERYGLDSALSDIDRR